MTTLSRKQREIQDREQLILDTARHMLTTRGYLGLNMDAIAEQLEYSKGTIYNHFPCKEEIIIALAVETMSKRSQMFDRAASRRGESRQRLTGVGVSAELFVRLYPEHFQVEQIIHSASLWEKTSVERRAALRGCETRCMGIVAGIVRDALAHGDLELDNGVRPEDLVFGLWTQTFGGYAIIATSDSLHHIGIDDPFHSVRYNINRMLDGYGWRPFSTEVDYISQFDQISSDIFPEERKLIASESPYIAR